MRIIDVTKNSVNSEPDSNSKCSLNDQQNINWVLIYIGSGLKTAQESYFNKSKLT